MTDRLQSMKTLPQEVSPTIVVQPGSLPTTVAQPDKISHNRSQYYALRAKDCKVEIIHPKTAETSCPEV